MEVLRTAIFDFCRRSRGKAFCPTEVVRRMYPEDWEQFVGDILSEAMQMERENLIALSQTKAGDGESSPDGILILGLHKPK